jgi:hypothetical protein
MQWSRTQWFLISHPAQCPRIIPTVNYKNNGMPPFGASYERDVFRRNGWKLAYLGPHVLRAEMACVAAVAAAATKLGFWGTQTATAL